MTTDNPSIQAQPAELRGQLAKLQSLRSLLGDELSDQKAKELESQIRLLVQTGSGSFFAGGVQVSHGDFVAYDKWQRRRSSCC